jgi:hypothetical protein
MVVAMPARLLSPVDRARGVVHRSLRDPDAEPVLVREIAKAISHAQTSAVRAAARVIRRRIEEEIRRRIAEEMRLGPPTGVG